MREFASKLGHIKLTFVIGFISVLLSVAIAYSAVIIFGTPFIWTNFILAIIIPAIIAPSVSWFFLKMYFRMEELEHEMRIMATYDPLTGLLTRKAFLDMSEEIYKKVLKDKRVFSVLYIDLDDFKKINDVYGHEGGDKVLSFFGEKLISIFRENDIIGRLGGEEMAVLVLDVEPKVLAGIIKRMQKAISSANIILDKQSINFTASIGISICTPQNRIPLDGLLAQADKALYKAKNSGKNCAYIYKGEENYEQLVSSNR